MKLLLALSATLAVAALPAPVLAWGATGHHIISSLAAQDFPADVPAFLKTADMPFIIGELGREPDRWKDSGTAHDSERDPGHFLDLDDDEKVMGGPTLSALPRTREDFDTALRAVHQTQYGPGFLPYNITDGCSSSPKTLVIGVRWLLPSSMPTIRPRRPALRAIDKSARC